jgi:hypothetical protein
LTVAVAVRGDVAVFGVAVSASMVAAPVPLDGLAVTHGADNSAVQAAFGVPLSV